MPILRTLQEMEVEGISHRRGVHIWQLATRLEMSEKVIGPQLDSLAHDGYISVANNTPTSGRPHRHMGVALLPEGRRALGEWPADPMMALAVALARALDEASDRAANPEERSRLRSLANQLREAGPGLAATLIVEGARLLAG